MNQININKNNFLLISFLLFLTTTKTSIDYLDTTFGLDAKGIVVTEIAEKSKILGLASYSGDKIVACGFTIVNNVQNLLVIRYNLDGTLDESFAVGGITTILVGSSSSANSVAIDDSNRIVVTGIATINGSNHILVARFNEDGSPDLNFGVGGKVTLLFGNHTGGNSVVIDANGKINVAGTASVSGTNNIIVARFNPDGSLDSSFDGNGIQTLTANEGYVGNCLKIDQNAKLVIGGTAIITTGYNFLVARLNPDGSIDNTFGTNGIVVTPFSGYPLSAIRSIFIDSSNKIVAGGFSGGSSQRQFTIARYNNNGTLDTTFGSFTNGYEFTSIGQLSEINSIANKGNKIAASGISDNKFAVAQYDNNGSLDLSFGIDGTLVNQLGRKSQVHSLLVQSQDSKLVAAGEASINCCPQCALTRYNNNNVDFINILTLNNDQIITTKIPIIAGSSSGNNLQVQIIVNGALFNTVSTDSLGNWNGGPTNVLPSGKNNIQVNLISGSNTIISQKVNVIVDDNKGEDSIFVYSNNSATSQSLIYSALSFNNLVKLGTWTYSNSLFTCNKTGTYLIEYGGNAGASGSIGATSIDVAMAVKINDTEYLGSESNATLDLDSNYTRPLTRSFVKDLNAGDTLTLNFAVNIVGSDIGFIAGLMLSPNKIGDQPTYSLTISRIS